MWCGRWGRAVYGGGDLGGDSCHFVFGGTSPWAYGVLPLFLCIFAIEKSDLESCCSIAAKGLVFSQRDS